MHGSSTGPRFGMDEAAVAAAKLYKFQPATRHGQPIEATVLLDQQFTVRPHLTAEATAEPVAPRDAPRARRQPRR